MFLDLGASGEEGWIRVPMIVRWTGKIKPGSESDVPWSYTILKMIFLKKITLQLTTLK